MATRQIRPKDEVHMEITRRAAKGGLSSTGFNTWEHNHWAHQLLIHVLIEKIQEHEPKSRQECAEINIEELLAQEISQMVEVLHAILPGGIMEIISYLPEEKQKQGWGRGVKW